MLSYVLLATLTCFNGPEVDTNCYYLGDPVFSKDECMFEMISLISQKSDSFQIKYIDCTRRY